MYANFDGYPFYRITLLFNQISHLGCKRSISGVAVAPLAQSCFSYASNLALDPRRICRRIYTIL